MCFIGLMCVCSAHTRLKFNSCICYFGVINQPERKICTEGTVVGMQTNVCGLKFLIIKV